MPLSFVGCKDKEEDVQVSFDLLSSALLDFDTKVRPFLSTLQYNYADNGTSELLNTAASTITTISYEMGESFKAFSGVLTELENNQSETTTVTKTSEMINIKTGTLDFTARLSNDGKSMCVNSKDNSQEHIFEIISKDDGRYYAQVVIKNEDKNNYCVYQMDFLGTSGTLNLDTAASGYISIYGADISSSVFPNVSASIFKNI